MSDGVTVAGLEALQEAENDRRKEELSNLFDFVESTGGLDEHKFYTICTTFRKSECAGASPHSQSSRGSRRSSAGEA